MVRIINAKKGDISLLIEYKLRTILPFVSDNREKLRVISYVNNFMRDNYSLGYIIKKNFKVIGAYLIKEKELDLLYIEEKYQNKGIGRKVINKIKEDIDIIKVREENKKAINFYVKQGFKVKDKNKDIIILEMRS